MAKRSSSGDAAPVIVGVDKDKSSQYALKWAVDNVLGKGQNLTLLHIKTRPSSVGSHTEAGDIANKELFLPFRCLCSRKEIKCNEVIYEDIDIAKGIVDYVNEHNIEVLVLGSTTKNSLFRFKSVDVPSSVYKRIPDFCSLYVISKGKVSVVKSATTSPRRIAAASTTNASSSTQPDSPPLQPHRIESHVNHIPRGFGSSPVTRNMPDELEFRSAFNRVGAAVNRPYVKSAASNQCDISFVSAGRSSIDGNNLECGEFDRPSSASEFEAMTCMGDFLTDSPDRLSASLQNIEDVEAEMRRLRLELKQTIDMYSAACKEALCAKQKALELQRWKIEEEQRLEEVRQAEEAALELAEREKVKCKAALEAAEAAQKIAEREHQRRVNAERKAQREAEERKKIMLSLSGNDCRYRRYSIVEIETATDNFSCDRKIGEGGYGPVYKCQLEHTPVAIKALRSDAAQGRSQFHQEVEILCCIRHPNMVLLLGACPEYGCLVYEYMANGSLEDRLFRRDNTPVIPWQLKFRIAAEIGTALLFLHHTKPEPLVHRDLKPANILLDRNYVSKISDVGLARLVPPSVVDTVTQYRMTSAAGTFCYIDPEYQQTGMLGIKSDIYSLGIMFLQIITAKPPMGLTQVIEGAIESGTFAEVLDPAVTDWPVDEALKFAKLALKCAEMRRKDRPDLGKVILPELNRLRLLGESNMPTLPQHLLNGAASP